MRRSPFPSHRPAGHAFALGALALGSLTLAACQNTSDPGSEGLPANADTSMTLPTNPSTSAGADTAGMGAAMNAALSDAQILHVFITSNRGEVLSSEPVTQGAAGDSAKAYARDMIAMHTDVVRQAEALGVREGLTPEANPVSAMLESRASQVVTALRSATGADLDRTYFDAQVELHQNTLDMLTTRLVPNTQNAALRAMLEGSRPVVAAHLDRARDQQGATGPR